MARGRLRALCLAGPRVVRTRSLRVRVGLASLPCRRLVRAGHQRLPRARAPRGARAGLWCERRRALPVSSPGDRGTEVLTCSPMAWRSTSATTLRSSRGTRRSTAIVTGAAKGIGAAIAEAFARAGWSLVAVDRDAAQLRAAASHWGQPVETLVGDVADRATNDAAVKMAIDRFGGLDAAVGNAG